MRLSWTERLLFTSGICHRRQKFIAHSVSVRARVCVYLRTRKCHCAGEMNLLILPGGAAARGDNGEVKFTTKGGREKEKRLLFSEVAIVRSPLYIYIPYMQV